VELNRRFLEGYTNFKDEPRVQKLRADVLKYNRLIRDLGIRDHQVRPSICNRHISSPFFKVPRAQKASWKTLGLILYRLLLLMIWTILALPGVILNGPMFILASLISRQKAKGILSCISIQLILIDESISVRGTGCISCQSSWS
jgi:glycerol-3-phosphate O-acyltransferase / dihydroxyacetone phosphate acyltransferase